MVDILSEQVHFAQQELARVKEYYRLKEIRLKEKQKKLNTYLKTGKILTEEELRND